MSDSQIQRVGGSRALQGCLFGSVALFVLLMVGMIILAILRFREETAGGPESRPGPVSMCCPAVPRATGLAPGIYVISPARELA